MPIRWLPVRKPLNSPWKISHSLTKPFSGGSAAMPSVPTRVMTALRGFVCSHQTLELARWHASHPEEWCEVCSGDVDPETHEEIRPNTTCMT